VKLPAGDAPWHGTENGYGNRKCRCDRCTDAHRVYYQGVRDRRRARGTPDGRYGSKKDRDIAAMTEFTERFLGR
jgi:hypothetical protein